MQFYVLILGIEYTPVSSLDDLSQSYRKKFLLLFPKTKTLISTLQNNFNGLYTNTHNKTQTAQIPLSPHLLTY